MKLSFKYSTKLNEKQIDIIEELSYHTTKLYNIVNYNLKEKEYKSYYDNNKLYSDNYHKQFLHSHNYQQCLKLLEKNWKSYFASIKDYNKNPNKYLGMPKPPKFKNNKDKKDILDIGLSSDSSLSSSNKKIKEPTQEEMDNQVKNAIGKIHPCTQYLISQGLIKENDAYIPNYNYIFYEALEKYDFELVRDVNNYVVSKMLKSEAPIKDKLSYFKSSFNSNLEIMYKRRNMTIEEMNDWLS